MREPEELRMPAGSSGCRGLVLGQGDRARGRSFGLAQKGARDGWRSSAPSSEEVAFSRARMGPGREREEGGIEYNEDGRHDPEEDCSGLPDRNSRPHNKLETMEGLHVSAGAWAAGGEEERSEMPEVLLSRRTARSEAVLGLARAVKREAASFIASRRCARDTLRAECGVYLND